MSFAWIVVAGVMNVVVLFKVHRHLLRAKGLRRERVIRDYVLPGGLFDALRTQHPHLQLKDCQLVAQGLRQFFLAYHKSGYRYVSMPSQVVDDLWHEFILHTRAYDDFCQKAFGRFFHHTPAAALGERAAVQSDVGLRRTWWHVCKEENLNPRAALRLPLLFALDAKLTIANGFIYALDCQGMRRATSDTGTVVHCGSDFGGSDPDSGSGHAGSGCGGGNHDSHSSGDGGGSDSGCSGGCGGGGCGGGGGD